VQNISDQIFNVIKDMISDGGARTIKMADAVDRCVTKGYKPDQIDECIEEYEELNVWQIDTKRTKIMFV
jgi:DNA replication licensing factor MCM7